jgi:hypothetical protein
MMTRGFYSVIQFCPDRFRLEAINVGLVLMCAEPFRFDVRLSKDLKRAVRFFGVTSTDLKRAMLGLESRLDSLKESLRSVDDFAAFAATRANDLRLTEPRLTKIRDFNEDFQRLFVDLVDTQPKGQVAKDATAEVLPPSLSDALASLQRQDKVWRPGEILVPVYRRKIDIPFAYRSQAAELAINGDLIQRHSENEKKKLIVLSTHETPKQAREIDDHVKPLFDEYGVRLVRAAEIDDYANEIRESAH